MSSIEQNENRQLDAMAELKISPANIFVDKQSGKDFARPAWIEMVEKLKEGDLLYVDSLDRIGRNYNEIQNWWKVLTKEKGVDIVILDMDLLDTRRAKDLLGTLVADLVLTLFSYIAQKGREDIRVRQAAGIKSARARGVQFGRPIKKSPENFGQLVKRWEKGEIHISEVLEITGLKEATFYRRLREHRISRKK